MTLKLFFKIYLAASGLSCAKELMWTLPRPGSEPHVPRIARLNLYYWATREIWATTSNFYFFLMQRKLFLFPRGWQCGIVVRTMGSEAWPPPLTVPGNWGHSQNIFLLSLMVTIRSKWDNKKCLVHSQHLVKKIAVTYWAFHIVIIKSYSYINSGLRLSLGWKALR